MTHGAFFLNEDRCSVYDKRPRSCRLFPLDAKVFLERLMPATSASNAGALRAIPRSDT